LEKDLLLLQHENDSLKKHAALLENKSINTRENDDLLAKLSSKCLLILGKFKV